MSFETLQHRRRVEVVTTGRPTEDDYGNEVTAEESSSIEWATRQQLSAEENTVDLDRQTRTFRYFFAPKVKIDGRSLIRDAGQTLKVIGEPEGADGPLGLHHWEVIATLTEG